MNATWRWRNLRMRHRLMLVFSAFCLLNTGLFSLYALVFAYTVEDQFFEAMLEDEARRQLTAFNRSAQWLDTNDAALEIYTDPAALPKELSAVLQEEPNRREMAATDGRHYHLLRLSPPDAAPVWLVAEVSQDLVFRRMRGTVFEILFYSALALLAIALLLAWWLAQSTAKPLTRLAELLADLQPNQLPDTLPHSAGHHEIAVLSRGLNDLVQRIRQFIAREQEFTRDASHELRTPLSVIVCAAEQIAANAPLDATATMQLDLIRSAATQLQQTITTLLTIAREEHCSTAPTLSCALLPLVERVVIEQSSKLDGKAVMLDIEIPRTMLTQLPEAVLHIVLSNLLGNAFAHCATDSRIRLRSEGTTLCIGNSHGAEHQIETGAFEKNPNSTGVGLGLAIVQRLSDRYGLSLSFKHSPAYTEVRLSLPSSDGSPAIPRASPSDADPVLALEISHHQTGNAEEGEEAGHIGHRGENDRG